MNNGIESVSFTAIGRNFTGISEQICAWGHAHAAEITRGLTGVISTVIAGGLLYLLLRWVFAPLLKRRYGETSQILSAAAFPAALLLLISGFSRCVTVFAFPAWLTGLLARGLSLLAALAVMMIFYCVWRNVGQLLRKRLARKYPEAYGSNKLLLDLTRSLVTLIAWCWCFFFILQNVFLMNVEKLLVSAGILGLGIAFAAQNTIANIFGAFSILGAKLFQVGDRIRVGGVDGVVEKIGVRSVRIRTMDGTMTDLPNRVIADSQLDNLSNRLYWREQFSYGLVYQTAPEQIERAQQIIAGIGRDFAEIMADGKPPKSFFVNCSDSSLDLKVIVWFKTADGVTAGEMRGRFNLEVLRRFNAAGLDFAYPTTTVFLHPDSAQPKEPGA